MKTQEDKEKGIVLTNSSPIKKGKNDADKSGFTEENMASNI